MKPQQLAMLSSPQQAALLLGMPHQLWQKCKAGVIGQGILPRPLITGKHYVSKRRAGCVGGYFKPRSYSLTNAYAEKRGYGRHI